MKKPQTVAVTVRRDKQTGRPILFFVNQSPRGWWLECYDRIGQHSECSREYMLSCSPITRVMADYEETVTRLAREWESIGPESERVPVRVVARLTYPRRLPYIGHC